MTRVCVERRVAAPPQIVFDAVANVANLPDTNPDIVKVRFLTERRSGVGTRFVETRSMNGKEIETELEIRESDDRSRIRFVADSHGTVWDTLFTVVPEAGGSILQIAMDARAHKLLPKLMNPILKGLFKRGMLRHIEKFAAYCDAKGKPSSGSPDPRRGAS